MFRLRRFAKTRSPSALSLSTRKSSTAPVIGSWTWPTDGTLSSSLTATAGLTAISPWSNGFTGIANLAAVTTGNSGGVSGSPFDAVFGSMIGSTAANLTTAYDRGVSAALSASSASYVSWNVGTTTTGYFRMYVRFNSMPPVTVRPLRAIQGGLVKWELRISTTGQIITGRQDGGSLQQSAVGAITTGVTYRFEMGVNGTDSDLRAYIGEDTTSPIAMTTLSPYDSGAWNLVRLGIFTSSAQTYALDEAGFAYSPETWIGPAAGTAQTATSSLDATAALTADATTTTVTNSTLTATGSLTAEAQLIPTTSSDLTATAALTANASRINPTTAALTTTSSLTSNAQRSYYNVNFNTGTPGNNIPAGGDIASVTGSPKYSVEGGAGITSAAYLAVNTPTGTYTGHFTFESNTDITSGSARVAVIKNAGGSWLSALRITTSNTVVDNGDVLGGTLMSGQPYNYTFYTCTFQVDTTNRTVRWWINDPGGSPSTYLSTTWAATGYPDTPTTIAFGSSGGSAQTNLVIRNIEFWTDLRIPVTSRPLTITGTVTGAPSVVTAATAALTATATVTSSALIPTTATSALEAAAALTAAGTVSSGSNVACAATATLTAGGLVTDSSDAILAGNAALTATGSTIQPTTAATSTVTAAATTAATVARTATGALSATAAVTSAATVVKTATNSSTATASLAGVAATSQPTTNTTSINAALTAAATPVRATSATLTATATTANTAATTLPATSTLSATATITTTGAYTATTTSAVTAAATLTAATSSVLSGTVTSTATGSFTAAATVTRPTTAALTATATATATAGRVYGANLATANMATGSDTLNTLEGFAYAGTYTTWQSSTDIARTGSRSIKYVSPDPNIGIGFGFANTTAPINPSGAANPGVLPVVAGRSYTASYWVNSNTGADTMEVRFQWFNAAGDSLGNNLGPDVITQPNTWHQVTHTATAPANAVTAGVYCRRLTGPASNLLYFDDMWFGEYALLTTGTATLDTAAAVTTPTTTTTTATATLTAAATTTRSASATLTANGAITTTGVVTDSGDTTLTATATITTSSILTRNATATATATAALTADTTVTRAATITLTATGAVTAATATSQTHTTSVALTATANPSAAGNTQRFGYATITLTSAFGTGTPVVTITATSSRTATSSLTVTAAVTQKAAATIAATSSTTNTAVNTTTATTTHTATSALTVAGTVTEYGTVYTASSGTVTVTATTISYATSNLPTTSTLTSNAYITSYGQSAHTATSALAANSQLLIAHSATLTAITTSTSNGWQTTFTNPTLVAGTTLTAIGNISGMLYGWDGSRYQKAATILIKHPHGWADTQHMWQKTPDGWHAIR